MSKTNETILDEVTQYDNTYGLFNSDRLIDSVYHAMKLAREDEREKISKFLEEFITEYNLPQLTNILDLIK